MEKVEGVYHIPKWITDYHKKFMLKERTRCFKTCSKCGETRLISRFPIDRRNPDGYSGICKTCKNKYYQARYARDKDRIKALNQKYQEKYREVHKESYQEYSRRYREEHKELFKDFAKKYYLRNRRAVIERSKKYYQDHKEAVAVRKKRYREENRDKIREYERKYRLSEKS